jgi:hypothetical protein
LCQQTVGLNFGAGNAAVSQLPELLVEIDVEEVDVDGKERKVVDERACANCGRRALREREREKEILLMVFTSIHISLS